MGAVNTTYTFTATDTITSTKMNNIIDQTTITDEAIIGNTLEVASGKLKVRAQGITSNEMATGSVTSNAILDGTIVNADINASAAIAGTKINPNFGSQDITTTGTVLPKSVRTYGSIDNDYGVSVINNGTTNAYGLIVDANVSPFALGVRNQASVYTFRAGGDGTIQMGGETGNALNITAAGKVGIGTSTPQTKLSVTGPSQAYSGGGNNGIFQITTGTGIDTDDKLMFGVVDGDRTWIQSVDPGNSVRKLTLNEGGGNIGIGKNNPSTALDVNGTVTATAFAGPLIGNASTATTASTVSNGAITAEKLNGAQGGDAPIFGVRAWVNFDATKDSTGAVSSANTNRLIRASGNVSSVLKTANGVYTVTFTTALPDANFAVYGSVSDNGGTTGSTTNQFLNGYQASSSTATITTTSTGSSLDDYSHVSVCIIR